MRPQRFEIEDDATLAEHQAGAGAHEHIDVATDIDVGRLVLKAPDRKVGRGGNAADPLSRMRKLVMRRRVRERGFSAQV